MLLKVLHQMIDGKKVLLLGFGLFQKDAEKERADAERDSGAA